MINPENTHPLPDRSVRLAAWVGLIVVGLSIAVGVLIQAQAARDLGPPEDVPRAVAIPALYATMGLLAIIGAIERRPAIVAAAGLLCFVGSILSIATLEFVVPGIVLIALGSGVRGRPRGRMREAVIAGATIGLVIGAAVVLLATTEGRCWTATGSPADPSYTVITCGGETVIPSGGSTFASGSDSADLTLRGGAGEAVLLVAALGLAMLDRRDPAGP